MFLAIIIPAYNEEKQLPNTITRIRKAMNEQSITESEWEIIVCDNNSQDRTAQIAQEMETKVVYEHINQISRARNQGAYAASGKWLLFIDADTYPSAEIMYNVLQLMKEDKIVGGGSTVKIDDAQNLLNIPLHWLTSFFQKLNLCGGAFLFCQKEAFEVIGGFSAEIFVFEDVDFIKRLKKYGIEKGLRFKVLGQHPVSTSGRRSSENLFSPFRLLFSAFVGYTIYLLHYLLPPKYIKSLSKRMLSYWYSGKRT